MAAFADLGNFFHRKKQALLAILLLRKQGSQSSWHALRIVFPKHAPSKKENFDETKMFTKKARTENKEEKPKDSE